MPFNNTIEWEILQNDKKFTINHYKIEFPYTLSEIKEIEIKRNDYYRIEVKIRGRITKNFNKEFDDFRDKLLNHIVICDNYETWILKNSHISNCETNYNHLSQEYCIFLECSEILFESKNKDNVDWIQEWYLNGPRNHFPHSTSYSVKKIFKRERNYCANENILEIKDNETCSTIKDFFSFKLEDGTEILINHVPSPFGPNWSKNIGIKYKSEEYISNKKGRRNIEKIISFLFGRKLLKIGESFYDSKGNKVKETMLNPNIHSNINLKSVCGKFDKTPIDIKLFNSVPIESSFSKVISNFIEIGDDLDLITPLDYYLASIFLPPESKIIMLASSLECLMNNWIDSFKHKNKSFIMDKEEFNSLIKDIKPKILENFKDEKPIIDNFSRLNVKSINLKLKTFFEDLGIELGDIEIKSLSYRNKPVHGYDLSSEDYLKLCVYSDMYQVLVNRVILTLLDFDGEYIFHNLAEPINISDKISYSIDQLIDNVYQFKSFNVDE